MSSTLQVPRSYLLICFFVSILFVCSCSSDDKDSPPSIEFSHYTYKIINTFPHDAQAFTQGLVFEDGNIYEGTGLYGRSSLRTVVLDTGEILRLHELPDRFFGEGIAILNDQIYQLTWKSNTGFIFSKETFEKTGEFSYPTQGWGLTHDNNRLIMSDGTSTLHFIDPKTLKEVDSIKVFDDSGPVRRLNELEYIDGGIYANVWQTNRIVVIDPVTGQVISDIDLTGLINPYEYNGTIDVLNGIAYDAENDRLFITGKLWPTLFEIELVPLNN